MMLPKDSDRSHVSKLLTNNLMQYMCACCINIFTRLPYQNDSYFNRTKIEYYIKNMILIWWKKVVFPRGHK